MTKKTPRLNEKLRIIRENPDISDEELEEAVDASLDSQRISDKTGLSGKGQNAITAEMEKEFVVA